MIKRSFLVSILVAFVVAGSAALSIGASWRGGIFGASAPESVIPASADLYLGVDHGGAQGAALSQLWAAYQSHPGTAAAVARLEGMMGARSLGQANSLLSSFGDRLGLALWEPANVHAQPQIAIVAQIRVTSFLSPGGPLTGLASLVPATTYQGTVVYRVLMKDGSSAYGAVVGGDGVLTTDLPTVERVIDTATYHAPSLASDPSFVATMATLPADRALTFYITPHFLAQAQRAARSTGASVMTPAGSLNAFQHPYGVAVVAAPDGLSIVSSPLTVPAGSINTTPNAGASVVGSNAVLYLSIGNLAATLFNSGLLPANTLSKLQAQTGIMVQRDVVPLISHEVVVDVNDEASPLLDAAAAGASGGSASQSVPTLPGSIELATWVDSPDAALASMRRLAGVLLHALQSKSATIAPPPLSSTSLPDGSTAYNITALPTVSFTFRGHWMLLSTNLSADVQAAKVPLSADPDYQAALVHVAGPGPLVSVQYLNVSRLLAVVDAWLAFTQAHSKQVSASDVATWHQFEPLVAPLRNIMSVTHQVGPTSEQGQAFITIKP